MLLGLPIILGAIAVAALAAGALWWIKRTVALRQAGEVYEDWTRESPGALRGLSEERFRTAYLRAHGAQAQGAFALTLLGVLLVTPLALIVLRLGWYWAWVGFGRQIQYAEGLLIWQFGLFFLLGGVWAGVAAIVARIHHSRPAGSLSEEILRESARKTL